ncbi:hypothetical protein [Chitinibacter tainanensis]|uniref:hypothetical protein n=1 Tax=Chitinibacter tainanensis TaxID=230667 RepID=UPI0006864700|nr:hypothetical protein [Chitinibacter tainanensis]
MFHHQLSIVGIDAAFRNVGLSHASYDLSNGQLTLHDLRLIETERDNSKKVRRNSDDLRCAREIVQGVRQYIQHTQASMLIAEVPTGGQSASAAKSFGIVVGILAGLDLPLIEVKEEEVKMVTVGKRNATKKEIIDWAVDRYPSLPWLTRKYKGQIELLGKNEHLADSVGVINAGVITEQFKSATAMATSFFNKK